MADDKVGYGEPPKQFQFKPGRSGNPKGRPKGSQSIAGCVRRILRERILVQVNGRRKFITKAEAIARQTVLKALTGDLRAVEKVAVLSQKAEDAARAAAEKQLREMDFGSFSIEQLERFIHLTMPPELRKELGLKELKVDKKILGDLFP